MFDRIIFNEMTHIFCKKQFASSHITVDINSKGRDMLFCRILLRQNIDSRYKPFAKQKAFQLLELHDESMF